MRWIILVCLIGCSGSHANGSGDDDDDGSSGDAGTGDGGSTTAGAAYHCGGLARSWVATGQGPSGIVSGDFDRDGIVDLAVAHSVDHTVSVMRGLGGGRFAPKVDYPVAYGGGLAVADFDRDGKLDLLTGGQLLLGNDDGSFQSPTYLFSSEQPLVAAGDLDGDGNPDLIAAGTSKLLVMRGLGNGTFAPQTTYPLDMTYPTVVIAMDLNGDGKLDAIVGGPDNVDVFLGHGDGAFGGKLSYPLSTSGYIAVGDVTGDGVPDLVVPTYNVAEVLPGMGNGSFGTPMPLPTLHSGTTHVAVLDVDGDGTLDIVAGDGATVEIIHGGDFAAPTRVYDEAASPHAWFATDLDGDGQPDLALAGYLADAVSTLFVDHGAFVAPPAFATAAGAIDVALVDVNADHHLDAVVLAQTAGTVSVLLGTGGGSFGTKRDAATGGSPQSFAVQDLDGDGRPDVAVGSQGSVNILRGKGDGGLMPKQDYMPAYSTALVAADFDSDGKPDLIVDDRTHGWIGFLPNAGSGTFGMETNLTYTASFQSLVFAAADLDNNGTPDLAMATSQCETTGSLQTYAGNGAGRVQPLDTLVIQHCASSIATADLDHDGKLDVVVAETTGYPTSTLMPVQVFLGTGGGHFKPGVIYPADVAPSHVAIADIDGDGVLDLVVAGNATEILYGLGDGTFGPRTPYGARAVSAAAADLDGDGALDVVTTAGSAIQVLAGRCH